MINVDFWTRAWLRARKKSSLYRLPSDPGNWQCFWDFYAVKYAERNRQFSRFYERMTDRLALSGLFEPHFKVLDIGCGPGTFTLPMARRCRQVTGLDTSKTMLTTLMAEADRRGLGDRISTDERDWSDIPEEPAYDLVLAAMTPAVMDRDSLMKMNHVSRKYCCLISTKGRFHSSLRDGLWKAVMGTDLESRAFDMQYPFNLLYHEGYLPEVLFFPYQQAYSETPAWTKEFYHHYFAVFGKTGGILEERIDAYIDRQTENEIVRDIHDGVLSAILWKKEK